MGVETALIGLGIAASVAGTAVGYVGAQKQAKAAAKAEELRKQQMDLDAQRKQRELVRQGVVARSAALSNATASGSEAGSGLQGGLAQITSNIGGQQLATAQNKQIGAGIFDANAAADQAGGTMAMGGALSSLGQGVLQNYGTYAKVFNLG